CGYGRSSARVARAPPHAGSPRLPDLRPRRGAPATVPSVRVIALVGLLLVASAAGPAPAHAQGGFHRGFVLTGARSDSFLSPRSDASLLRMANDGSDHVAIFSQWFLADCSASVL